jgi:hypothetical protein
MNSYHFDRTWLVVAGSAEHHRTMVSIRAMISSVSLGTTSMAFMFSTTCMHTAAAAQRLNLRGLSLQVVN